MDKIKEIALLTSTDRKMAESLAETFGRGNRLRLTTIVTDNENLGDAVAVDGGGFASQVETAYFDRTVWESRGEDVAGYLKSRGIGLVVADSLSAGPDEALADMLDREFGFVDITGCTPDQAIGKIVSLYMKRRESAENKSVDASWAEALHIQFDEDRVRKTVPPPVPPVSSVSRPTPPAMPGSMPPVQGGRFSGPARNQDREEAMPPTYLIWSVLCVVCCCFVPGIIAIVFSSQVSSRYYAGDIEGARRASRNAEIWIIVSFVLGVLSATLYLPLMMIS